LFYYMLGNLPPVSRSKLSSINLLCITKSQTLVRYGPNVILEPVMSDIKELEQNGLVVTTGNSQTRFYGSLFLVPGDNLASQYLGGYKSLASAHRKCRTCMTTNEDMQNKVAALSSSATRPHIESTFGLCQDSVFHQSQYFHITDGLVPDIMHDVLEGCLPYVMKEMMKLYIDRKLISLNDMNDLIISFPYGSTDFSNKPSLITSKTLKSSDHALKQTASQYWCLGRLLPLIIGHLVPENDLHWNNFCLLLTIIDYLFAPTLPQEAIDNLSVMIADHHKAFKELHPTCNIIPKMHYMIHYPYWIRRVGPLVRAWCMRFEGKHTYFKNIASRMKCFKNACKTLAMDHQYNACYMINSSEKPVIFDWTT
uniref:Uncharacterized protein n=1 Tax=Amphimedon queenslandica TaxID=400682 RepID=A0A1X7T5K3_AMPQE